MGHEEFDLGIRLRSAGWRLHRLDRRYVQHFGHTLNSLPAARAPLEEQVSPGCRRTPARVSRQALLHPAFARTARTEAMERGLCLVGRCLAALLLFLPDTGLALGLVLALLAGIIALMRLAQGRAGHGVLYRRHLVLPRLRTGPWASCGAGARRQHRLKAASSINRRERPPDRRHRSTNP